MGEISPEIKEKLWKYKDELIEQDANSNMSELREWDNCISLKDHGVSYIKDLLKESIAYLLIGYLLSKTFIGPFFSGILTFMLIIYWKYCVKD